MLLSLRVKKLQLFDYTTSTVQPIYYALSSGVITKFFGTIPTNTFITASSNSSDISINIEVQDNRVTKQISGSIMLYGIAATLVKEWLFDSGFSQYNEVEVEVTDASCNKLIGTYIIDKGRLKFCGEKCEVEVELLEYDRYADCLGRVDVTSNWQGWFPNAAVGSNPLGVPAVRVAQTANAFPASVAIEHIITMPFVRTLIQNVMTRCGLTANNDAFDDVKTSPTFGNGSIFTALSSPYYNTVTTVDSAPFSGGATPTPIIRPAGWWQTSMNMYMNLPELLSKVLTPHNAYWYLEGTTFYHHVKGGRSVATLYDFSAAIDRAKMCKNECYERNETSNFRAVIFNYTDDNLTTTLGRRIANDAEDWNQSLGYSNAERSVLDIRVELGIPQFMNSKEAAEPLLTFPSALSGDFISTTIKKDLPKLAVITALGRAFSPYAVGIDPVIEPLFNTAAVPYHIKNGTLPATVPRLHFNYDYAFEPWYEKNLYWRFWHRESSLLSGKKGTIITQEIRNCCYDKDRLGLFKDALTAIGRRIISTNGQASIIRKVRFSGDCITIESTN